MELELLDDVDDVDELELAMLAALTGADDTPPRRAEGSVAPAQTSSPVKATANKDERWICMIATLTERTEERRFEGRKQHTQRRHKGNISPRGEKQDI